METKILKHLTVTGFIKGKDISECESLQNKLDTAKLTLKEAKKSVREAKAKLNIAVQKSLEKIEANKRLAVKNTEEERDANHISLRVDAEDTKTKFMHSLSEWTLKKKQILQDINAYESDGSEKWDQFRKRLIKDLEFLSKSFVDLFIQTK